MFRLPCGTHPLLLVATYLVSALPLQPQVVVDGRVQAVRYWSFGDVTRIAIQTEGAYRLSHDQIDNPARAFFDLSGLRPPSAAHHGYETISVNDRRVKQIRIAPLSGNVTRLVFDLEAPAEIVSSQLVNPDRLMIEIRPKEKPLPQIMVARSTGGLHRLQEPASTPTTTSVRTTPPPSTSAIVPAHVGPSAPDSSQTALSIAKTASPAHAGSIPETLAPTLAQQASTNVPRTTPVQPAPVPSSVSGANTSTSQIALNVPPASIPTSPSLPAPPMIKYGDVTPAKPMAGADRSLVRVFGLKLSKVVIDAGHGGHDTGTIGPDGLLEKDLVLDVALRLGALITKQLGAEVVYTRSEDVFIPLEQRTKIANEQKADLFLSIHANSSPEPRATGVETYFFNFTTDKASVDLASRENAMSSSSISDLNDLLHRAVLQTKLEESRQFAQDVQSSLWAMSAKMNNQSKNRGVRQAPFVVLIGATMPSILAEVGFVSNGHDEKLMRKSDQRQRIAEALYKGVAAYANTLSHVELARAGAH